MIDNMVRVYNRNAWDFSQRFKGDDIKIPANSFIKMDYDEAVMFLGSYSEMKYDKGGMQDPRSYKWLEIDKDDKERIRRDRGVSPGEDSKTWDCQSCGKTFRTEKGYLNHIKSKHLDEMVDSEKRDEILDNDDLDGSEE